MNTQAPDAAVPLPPDYYERLFEIEDRHWWPQGMRRLSAVLLRERLAQRGLAVLDAGCGTGGFLRWLLEMDAFESGAGVDIGAQAIELAQRTVPAADLRVAEVADLPFPTASFDVAVMNDVLQHIPEGDVSQSFSELRRVLKPGGTLLIRTGGARRYRVECIDWRIYDRRTLRAQIEDAGFACHRLTYANFGLSVAAALRGRNPRAPTPTSHGIPTPPGRISTAVGSGLLRLEALLIEKTRLGLPYGHTLLALASR